jgi:hypothetical protein
LVDENRIILSAYYSQFIAVCEPLHQSAPKARAKAVVGDSGIRSNREYQFILELQRIGMILLLVPKLK